MDYSNIPGALLNRNTLHRRQQVNARVIAVSDMYPVVEQGFGAQYGYLPGYVLHRQ